MKGDNGSKSTCKEKLNYTTAKKYRERWGKMMIDMQQLNLLESTGNCGFQLHLSVKDEKGSFFERKRCWKDYERCAIIKFTIMKLSDIVLIYT
jgi:hypothetical protein